MKYPIPVVRVILKNPIDEILFLKRASKIGYDKWAFPGGKVEVGQTLEQACKDELKQETNLEIFDLKFFCYSEDLPSHEDKNHWIVFYFDAGYKGRLRINEESFDLKWIAFDDLKDYDIAFGHDRILENYKNNSF